MNKLKKRLKSQVGETIAEVLVALLVSAFALMMLAVMIRSAERSVKRSNEAMNAYYSSAAVYDKTVDLTVAFKKDKNDTTPLEEYEIDEVPSNSKTLGNKTVISYAGGTT